MTTQVSPKVLIACDFYWPSVGGVETIVANLGETLTGLGYEVEIAARALPNRTANHYRGMVIHSLDAETMGANGLPRASQQLKALIESGHYSGVIMRADPLNWVIWSLEGTNIPAHTRVLVQPLINEDGYGEWRGNTHFRQRLAFTLRQATNIVCLTHSGPDARYMKEEGISFIHLPNATTPLASSTDFRRDYGFDPHKPLLVHVANLWPVKNHINLVKTFKSLALDCQLALIGNPSGHGDYVEKVRSLVAEDRRIKLLHGLSGEKVAAAMKAADLVILPSLGEVFPVSIIEAMSHGKAWLATPQCGAANELSGGIIAPLADFPRVITEVLGDKSVLERLGNLGHQHWKHCNQWSILGQAWSELINTGKLSAPLSPPPGVWAETLQLRERFAAPVLPLISVVIPTKNRPQLLAQALQSLQFQEEKSFEVIIVNDGGCNLESLINYYGQNLAITYIQHPASKGAAAARNAALRVAQGNIIAYLDDDDYFHADHLLRLRKALEESDVDFVFTDAEYVVYGLKNGVPFEKLRARPYEDKGYSRDELLVANYIPTPTWGHRRNLIEKVGYFDETMSVMEDWDFLVRLSKVAKFQKIPQCTVEVRQSKFRTDHTLPSTQDQLPSFELIYKKYPVTNPDIQMLRNKLLQQIADGETPQKPEMPANHEEEYSLWQQKHTLEPIHAQIYAEHMMAWPRRPRFTVVVPTRQENLTQLAATLTAMENQLYKEWQFIVVADYEAPSPLFLQSDTLGWLQIDDLNDDAQLAAAYNGLVELGGDWIGILPPGSELSPHAFLALGDYAQAHPQWSAIYTDHDHKDDQGQYVQPWFKPDFNLDYLRSMDYVGAALWFKGEALQRLGGFQPFPGAWLYDALLRLLDGEGGEAIGHIAEPLHHFPVQTQAHPLAQASRQVALENHLQRRGTAAQISAGLVPDTFHVQYQRPDAPLVSLIIPNRDFVWFLRPCLESLFAKTDYGNYEVVIVDNQTEDPDTLAYYEQLKATQGDRLRIVPYDRPFNFSAQCNLGVSQARGEYVVLLNNDTEIVQGSWLTRMVSHLARPEVGIVGARLVYPETGKIQHAGIILGMDHLASHGFMRTPMEESGYMNRLQVEQDYSAVTAACLLVAKDTYLAVGGMDEDHAAVLFNDVDFCLKVRSLDKLVVWTPFATLVHHASVSLKSEMEEIKAKARAVDRDRETANALHQRWRKWLREDPAYNRHLALHTSLSFRVEGELVADWDANFRDRPRVLALPPSGGVGEYRFCAPLRRLAEAAKVQSTIVQTKRYHDSRYLTLSEMERLGPDVLMAQAAYAPVFQEWLERYREMLPNLRINLMIDDLITEMPRDNPNFKRIPRDGRYRLRKLFKLADSVIVSTQPLLDLVSELTDKGVLVPNTLRDELWLPLQSRKRTGPKPRVGWAGAQQHKGDLAIIANVVKRTASQVDWVFFGMCPDEIRPYIAEFHDFVVGVEAYPAKLASLNLDLAVAPLEQHPFNEAKSNLRILEYGILGLPVICTDIYPYRTDDAPVTRVPNEEQAWVEAILERASHPDQAEREGAALKQWVERHYLLSQVQDLWFQAITGPRA